MKKITLSAIANYLRNLPEETMLTNPNYHGEQSITPAFSVKDIIAELDTELNRGSEEKAAKAAEYEAVRPAVLEAMEIIGHPATASEIFAEAEKDLPSSFSQNRLQYGLTHYWEDIIVKYNGKPCTYYFKD